MPSSQDMILRRCCVKRPILLPIQVALSSVCHWLWRQHRKKKEPCCLKVHGGNGAALPRNFVGPRARPRSRDLVWTWAVTRHPSIQQRLGLRRAPFFGRSINHLGWYVPDSALWSFRCAMKSWHGPTTVSCFCGLRALCLVGKSRRDCPEMQTNALLLPNSWPRL